MRLSRYPKNAARHTRPIYLEPADPEEFKRRLLATRHATMSICYKSGYSETKDWFAERVTERTDIMRYLRSRPEFKKDAWRKAGIKFVCVTVR